MIKIAVSLANLDTSGASPVVESSRDKAGV